MRAAKTLDFLPEGEPVVQIIPEAHSFDVLVQAGSRLTMVEHSLIVMSEHKQLTSTTPELEFMLLSWAQLIHEAAAMVDHVRGQIYQATEAEVNHE